MKHHDLMFLSGCMPCSTKDLNSLPKTCRQCIYEIADILDISLSDSIKICQLHETKVAGVLRKSQHSKIIVKLHRLFNDSL